MESKVYLHCCIHHLSNVLCRPVNFSQFFRHFQFHIRPLCTGIYELEDCSLDKGRWENIAGDNYVYKVNKCPLRYISDQIPNCELRQIFGSHTCTSHCSFRAFCQISIHTCTRTFKFIAKYNYNPNFALYAYYTLLF